MMTLQEALEYGWEGEEAQRYVEWSNRVEELFRKLTGLDPLEVVGDWPQAIRFEEGDTPEEALEAIDEEFRRRYGFNPPWRAVE